MTAIERGYEEQGFRLPEGWTWEEVASERTRWGIRAIYVPVAHVMGTVAWAVPFVDGKPMRHEGVEA